MRVALTRCLLIMQMLIILEFMMQQRMNLSTMCDIQLFNTKYIHMKIQAGNKLKRGLYEE